MSGRALLSGLRGCPVIRVNVSESAHGRFSIGVG
jgi:hypothetical protein